MAQPNPPPVRTPIAKPDPNFRVPEVFRQGLQSTAFSVHPAWAKWAAFLQSQVDAIVPGGSSVNPFHAITYAATITPDYDDGINQECTLTGNVTVNFPSNAVAGGEFCLVLVQDATGGRVITLNAGYLLGESLAYQDANTCLVLKGIFLSTTELRVTSFRQGDPA